jgi:GNAT superfamily N-acetyltransferase
VSDFATFAWLCDVYILEEYRGRGIGKWLMETILAHPDLQGLRRFLLATRDAHELYSRYGFTLLHNPSRWMEKFDG